MEIREIRSKFLRTKIRTNYREFYIKKFNDDFLIFKRKLCLIIEKISNEIKKETSWEKKEKEKEKNVKNTIIPLIASIWTGLLFLSFFFFPLLTRQNTKLWAKFAAIVAEKSWSNFGGGGCVVLFWETATRWKLAYLYSPAGYILALRITSRYPFWMVRTNAVITSNGYNDFLPRIRSRLPRLIPRF